MDDSAREVILILSMSVSILPRSYSDGMSRDGLGITDGSVTAIGPVLDCSSFDIARGVDVGTAGEYSECRSRGFTSCEATECVFSTVVSSENGLSGSMGRCLLSYLYIFHSLSLRPS